MTDKLVARLMQASELEMMRVCHVIRVIVGFSKKVVFKLMRQMKNGALWIKYSVDGVNCSTFAKALKVLDTIKFAHVEISHTAKKWFVQQAGKAGLSARFDFGDDAAQAMINGKTFYVTTDQYDNYVLYANSRMISSRHKTRSAMEMVKYIQQNWKAIN